MICGCPITFDAVSGVNEIPTTRDSTGQIGRVEGLLQFLHPNITQVSFTVCLVILVETIINIQPLIKAKSSCRCLLVQ